MTATFAWSLPANRSSPEDYCIRVGRGRRVAAAAAGGCQALPATKITVKHVYQAVSAGLAVYPGGIENQIVGGVTQILSRLLVEKYRYSKTNVTSADFVTYPILRFKDAPAVTPIVIQWSSRVRFMEGVGMPMAMAAAAAVANAFFDATGVRMRTAPMTPARVRATLRAAGVA